MIIEHFTTFLLDEIAAESQFMCLVPNLLHLLAGSAVRIRFIIESSSLSTYHVEQDAVTGKVSRHVRCASPILGA